MSHYKPYPAYKDSGVEWLGKIPTHWTLGPYKALIQIENGADYKEVEAEEGFPVIGSGGAFAYASQKMYEGESVLLGRKGTIDKPLYVNGPFWTVDTMYWSIIKKGACGRFAYYVATTIPFDMYSTNTALPSMTKSVLGAHQVAFPDISEQKAIAAHLDRETARIDALISKKTRFIELLREKRQALITHAVTKGLDPKVKMKDSGVEWLVEVPEHWSIQRLRFAVGLNPTIRLDVLDEQEVSFLPMEAIGEQGSINLDRTRLVGEAKSGYSYFEDGDVAFAKVTPCFENGKGAVMKGLTGGLGFGTTELTVLRPKKFITSDYINLIVRSSPFRGFGEGAMTGAGGLKRVPDEFTRNFIIALPSEEEQLEIVVFIAHEAEKIDCVIGKTERSIELLKERRSALITAAVTGQIDLREAA